MCTNNKALQCSKAWFPKRAKITDHPNVEFMHVPYPRDGCRYLFCVVLLHRTISVDCQLGKVSEHCNWVLTMTVPGNWAVPNAKILVPTFLQIQNLSNTNHRRHRTPCATCELVWRVVQLHRGLSRSHCLLILEKIEMPIGVFISGKRGSTWMSC